MYGALARISEVSSMTGCRRGIGSCSADGTDRRRCQVLALREQMVYVLPAVHRTAGLAVE
jgi:hypothetical protein